MRRQMSNKADTDIPAVYPRWSARMLKMNFTEPDTFGFFWFSTGGRFAPEAGRSTHGDEWYPLIHRTVQNRDASFAQFLSKVHRGVADSLPEWPRWFAHR
jgi:hypothetical protein